MKTRARRSFEVKTTVAGKPVVRVIDASLNAKKFEYRLTNDLVRKLKKRGITLEQPPAFPVDTAAFFEELARPGDYNCLILVAHGEVPRPTAFEALLKRLFGRLCTCEKGIHVRLAGLRCPWLLLGKAEADLQDKVVMLAVCGGYCPDTTWAFVKEEHNALLLLASGRKVSGAEVRAVFPTFLENWKNALATDGELTPEAAREALEKCGDEKAAFSLVSGVGFIPAASSDQGG